MPLVGDTPVEKRKTTGNLCLFACLFVCFFKHFMNTLIEHPQSLLNKLSDSEYISLRGCATIWVNVTNRGHVWLLRVESTECKIRASQIPVKTINYYLLRKLVREVKSRCLCCISSPFFEEKSLSTPFWSHFDVAGVSFSNLWQATTRRESFKNPWGVDYQTQKELLYCMESNHKEYKDVK